MAGSPRTALTALNDRLLLPLAAGIAGMSGVAAGAFGAHALQNSLTPELSGAYDTAVLYHLLHAVALLALSGQRGLAKTHRLWAGLWFALGICLFSGSLYALALGGPGWLGPLTPLGGLSFLGGWLVIAASGVRNARLNAPSED